MGKVEKRRKKVEISINREVKKRKVSTVKEGV